MNSAAQAFNERYGLNVSANAFRETSFHSNVANDLVGKPKRNFLQTLKRFFAKPSSLIAFFVLIIIVILAIVLPILSPYSSVDPIVNRAGENNVFANLPQGGAWRERLIGATEIDRFNALGMVQGVDYFVGAPNASGLYDVNYDVWKFARLVATAGGEQFSSVSVLGTDAQSRDVWTRTWDGTWESIKLGVFSAVVSAFFGTILGCLVGLRYGSKLDIGVNRLIEAYNAIPYIVWVALLISIFPQNFWGLAAFFIITSWVSSFYVARFNIVKFINTDYIKVARISGVSPLGLIFKHALPNFIGIMAITVMGLISSTIISQAYIGILGFSYQSSAAYLGNVMQEMRTAISGPNQNLLFVFVPTIILLVITLSTRYIALGINDAVDPRFVRR